MTAVRLHQIFRDGRFGLSIEVFPPKSPEGDATLRETLRELAPYRPAFVSCTYGAGGSTSKRTLDWCAEIQEQFGLPATAHFTCVGHTRAELVEWLRDADRRNIRNIMALRGDPPAGQTDFRPIDGGLAYANELVALIREHFADHGVGVGGYPEKHPQASDLATDIENLKRKIDAGADAVFTQLFYDNAAFFRFREMAARAGIQKPIVPGIMPITEFARIQRIASLSGASLPAQLVSQLEAVKEDKAAQFRIGVDFAIHQCRELIDQGVHGLHLYALNRSHACRELLDALGFPHHPA